jgi:hypothetical protein
MEFSRHARRHPSSIFTPDMLEGEAQELFSERMEAWARGVWRKVYKFQVRNDDGFQHFRSVSRRYRGLWFVLVYGDPNGDAFGSYLIRLGRGRHYRVPRELEPAVMARHSVSDDSDEDWRYWEASWELMDLAEAQWRAVVQRAIAPSRSNEG